MTFQRPAPAHPNLTYRLFLTDAPPETGSGAPSEPPIWFADLPYTDLQRIQAKLSEWGAPTGKYRLNEIATGERVLSLDFLNPSGVGIVYTDDPSAYDGDNPIPVSQPTPIRTF